MLMIDKFFIFGIFYILIIIFLVFVAKKMIGSSFPARNREDMILALLFGIMNGVVIIISAFLLFPVFLEQASDIFLSVLKIIFFIHLVYFLSALFLKWKNIIFLCRRALKKVLLSSAITAVLSFILGNAVIIVLTC